jgi:plastocyanin
MFKRIVARFDIEGRKMFKARATLICAMLGLSMLTVAVLPVGASVDNYRLFGSASQGWGFTPGSISSPGPTITVTQGDLVNLTLTSQDGFTHRFFVDYNGNGAPDPGEPASPSFSGTINFQFNATTSGTFTYFCQFHPGVMHGKFTVNAGVAAPDVGVTNVTSVKTVVGQGYVAGINVTVANNGNVDETFNMTAYRLGVTSQVLLSGSASSGWNGTIPGPAMTVNLGDTVALTLVSADQNSHQFFVDYNGNASPNPGEPTSPIFSGTTTYVFTANVNGTFNYYCSFHPGEMHGTFTVTPTPVTARIDSQTVSPPLAPAEVRVLKFAWNTTGIPFGNYTLNGVADTVAGETNTANNNYTDGAIIVSIPGDLNGDLKVGLPDLAILAKAYGATPSDPRWNVNADINGDGKVSLADLSALATHYGQHYP